MFKAQRKYLLIAVCLNRLDISTFKSETTFCQEAGTVYQLGSVYLILHVWAKKI